MALFATLKSIAAHLPDKCVRNADFEGFLDTSDEWIQKRTGIKTRYFAAKGESSATLGTKAAKIAIERANLEPRDIDMVICATLSPDFLGMPSTACLISHALGIEGKGAFDISAACSGFIYLLFLAKSFVESGACGNVLIVGAEKISSVLDFSDRSTCVLFGDGAGAAVVGATSDEKRRIIDVKIAANGKYSDLLATPRVDSSLDCGFGFGGDWRGAGFGGVNLGAGRGTGGENGESHGNLVMDSRGVLDSPDSQDSRTAASGLSHGAQDSQGTITPSGARDSQDSQCPKDSPLSLAENTPQSAKNPQQAWARPFLTMKGNETFKLAVKTLASDVKEILARNNLTQRDVDFFIPHQANLRIINAVGEATGIDPAKIVLTIHKYGNTSAASIPMAMNEIFEAGRLRSGDLLLLDAFGGGLTWGSSLLYFNG